MALNAAGAADVVLETFGGLVTDTPASNLPPGVSPDVQDMVFVPGGTESRPPLAKVFATAFPAGGPLGAVPTLTYAKSYVDPTGIVRNLYLDSNGSLWLENVTSNAGVTSLLTSTTPGSYAKSATAFGREYLAISDGLHGSDIPLQYDGTNLDRVTQDGPGAPPTIANSVLAPTALVQPNGLFRDGSGNVTATTSVPHNFKVGYQVLIAGAAVAPLGGVMNNITSIVINNEDSPGLALVTTSVNHGLSPQTLVSIRGVTAVAVGGGISATARVSGIVKVTTAASHGLSVGSLVTIAGAADATVNGVWTVASIVSATVFTFVTGNLTDTTGGAAGTVSLNWPLSQAPDETLYEVVECPSLTTFQIQLSYSDGTWASGTVFFPWNGSFFVTSVPSTTTFTYHQIGPQAATTLAGGPAQVVPVGQAAPGQHQCRVSFLTRQGYVTRPSPPVPFIANGGQYLSITNIPIGPSNVVARILEFTGAGGAYFFYLPVAPQVNGLIVATPTQINDNTTTSITLDFSDNTLFAGIATSIPGNNTPAQIILDGALGFAFYGGRLITWGQRNRIQNLLNMGFDGGWLSGTPTIPLGWTYGGAGGALANGHYGKGWQITGATTGQLTQPFYLDAYGAPIGTPNATYRARAWLKGAAGSLVVTISSASTGFSSTVTLSTTNNSTGEFKEGAFTTAMPATIPTDMILKILGTNVLVDELSIIYAASPYLDTILYGSYVNNPEGFDGLSGKFGAADDTRKVMDLGIIRSNLYLFTQDPSGRLHQTSNNSFTEPVGWIVDEVAANCGLLSAFALTKSQADDASAGGGEEWLAWASLSGARIFGGDQAWKISQEIQPNWDSINPNARLTAWALNDPASRRIYFGLPTGGYSAPAVVYVLDYRGLETPYLIAMSPPLRVGPRGLFAPDTARKWAPWNVLANNAAMIYRIATGGLTLVFCGGNGTTVGAVSGTGNLYRLAGQLFKDADFGQFFPYYTTYFFTTGDAEEGLQLRAFLHMIEYMSANVAGVGQVTVTVFVNDLTNPWPLNVTRALAQFPRFDLEWSAASANGQRFAFKFAAFPPS